MLRFLWTISFIFISSIAYAKIGSVVKHDGVASVERENKKMSLQKYSDILYNDDVRTGMGNLGITFIDETTLALSPHSSVLIDDFIYNPEANKRSYSSLVLNVIQGTARYASGNIAKLAGQNVKITTPTCVIGVRGTAFSMTVDEIGKSLVILLPNVDGTVGEISVESGAGVPYTHQSGTCRSNGPGRTGCAPSPA